jgi:Fe-S oxidoreductase
MSKYQEQIHRCFRCGYCKFPSDYSAFNCPSYNRFRFDTYSTGGRLWLINAWTKGEVPWSEHLAEILYTCTTCKNCTEQCPMKFAPDIVEWIIAARSEMVEQGKIPTRVKRFLESVYNYGNPLKIPHKNRDAWSNGTRKYQQGDEYLLYVGCLGSYDENAQKMTKSLVDVLKSAGVSFGILGSDEMCCGNEVYAMGETELFNSLANANIKKYKEMGVTKVITLSPHAYNTMKNQYQGIGYSFEVLHYTQLLDDLIKQNKLKMRAENTKVTYHDPCYLGRHNRIYDAPRDALRGIRGIDLVEMERNRADAFCCGGGSGNFITDYLAGSEASPSRVRVREAKQTGADVLAVACPGCLVMLNDATKAEDLEGKLQVKDIATIIKESMII